MATHFFFSYTGLGNKARWSDGQHGALHRAGGVRRLRTVDFRTERVSTSGLFIIPSHSPDISDISDMKYEHNPHLVSGQFCVAGPLFSAALYISMTKESILQTWNALGASSMWGPAPSKIILLIFGLRCCDYMRESDAKLEAG